jgi:hypothetical protein
MFSCQNELFDATVNIFFFYNGQMTEIIVLIILF